MKAEELQLQAFGSYRRLTRIDFRELGENPLFLITGSTGGGKTTLLDAMCFALYCRATGGRRSWGSMRCMEAPDEEETFVEFTFSLGRERYRFRRSRTYYKGRGTGERKVREEHAAYRWDGEGWELLVSGAESRVREKAEELLGLTCEQFSQVVVLPQGDFLRLLLANSREKAAMFQTLFGAARWERVSRRLRELAAAKKAQADRLTAERASLLAREEAETPEQLSEKLASFEEEGKVLAGEAGKLEKELGRATEAWNAASLLERQFQLAAELAQRAEGLEKKRPAMEQAQARLTLCRRASAFSPHLRSLQAAEKDQAENGKRLSREITTLREEAERRTREEQDLRRKQEEAEARCRKGEEFIKGLSGEAARLAPLTQRVQELTRRSAASALASVLREGQPCPVCGSVHHPAPAAPSPELEQTQAALEQARAAAAKQTAAQQRLEQRRREQKEAASALEQCRAALAACEARRAAAQAAWEESQAALARTAESRRQAEEEFRAALPQEGKEIPLSELLLSPDQLEAREREIQQYQAAVASCEEQRKRAAAEIAGKERPHMQEARAALDAARARREEAVRRAAALAQRLESGKQSLKALRELEETAASAARDYERTERLGALLSGKNARRIPLQQFVLGIMLDDILSAANLFFSQFSTGRYALRRVREAGGGHALAGLDLEVLDAQCGSARAVETLSGGELFLASLSLAFGLSSVVQAVSGSVRLDSIFIDEGFGTLDQETLDTAMRALSQVQGAGRTVGVISHVSELRTRILRQIRVSRLPDGSSTASVFA